MTNPSNLYPTGTLTFSTDGQPAETASQQNGYAVFHVGTLPVGSHTVTAAYTGDDSLLASGATTQLIVSVRPTTQVWIWVTTSSVPSATAPPPTMCPRTRSPRHRATRYPARGRTSRSAVVALSSRWRTTARCGVGARTCSANSVTAPPCRMSRQLGSVGRPTGPMSMPASVTASESRPTGRSGRGASTCTDNSASPPLPRSRFPGRPRAGPGRHRQQLGPSHPGHRCHPRGQDGRHPLGLGPQQHGRAR